MARRFEETVNIQQQDLSTGFTQGANTLLNRLQQFKGATERLVDVAETKRGAEEAQEVDLKKVGGITQAPEKRVAGVLETVLTGGVSTKQYNKSLQTAYLASLGNDTKEAINAIEAENPDNIAQFNEKAAGYASGVLKGVDPSARQQISQFLDNTISNSRLRVHRKNIRKNKSEAEAESLVAATSFANESARLSREGNTVGAGEFLIQSFDVIDGLVESGGLSADRAANMKREIERESTEQTLRGQFDTTVETDGPEAALEQLNQIENKIPKGWTPDEWDTFVKSEKASLGQELTKAAKLASEVSIEQAREISNIKIQASTGTGDAGKIVQRTETLFNEGKISPSERTSILTKIVNQQKGAIKKAADFAQVAKRYAGDDGIVLEPSVINDYYKENMVEPLSQLDPALKVQQQALFVDRMKHVPDAMRSEITTQLRSGDPDLIADASELIDRIDSTPGLIDRTFTEHDRAFAQQVVSLSANLEPEEAVKLATDLTDPTNQARIDSIKNVIKDKKLADEYPSIVQDAFNPFGPFEGTQVGEISLPLITREYKDLFESHYEAGMTENNAKEKALALIKRNWKKSEVTGQVMKYAPDDYYQVSGSVDYIKNQLVNDVNKEFIFEKSVRSEQLFLQATETTARTASQGNPEYRVVMVIDGNITPLYGFTWKPDQQKQIDKVTKENEKALLERRESKGSKVSSAILKDIAEGPERRRKFREKARGDNSGL